jgi:mannose-6-phosphate isomerase-like protein (cupin superfamily)
VRRLLPPLLTAALLAARAGAQEAPAAADSAPAGPFACGERDLAGGAPTGCQLVARPTVTRLPSPLYWHLVAFPTREAAQVASRFTDVVTEAGGEVWLHRFGTERDVPAGGTRRGLVGPITPPRAAAFQLDLFYEVMPAGSRTAPHLHPGPEAWWVLEGTQCVATAKGAERTGAGEGTVGPAGNVARIVASTDVVARRAFALLIRDPVRPRQAPSRWKPKQSACGAS